MTVHSSIPPPIFQYVTDENIDWRDVPLLRALSYGVASVEADVWLAGNDLLVGVTPPSAS